MIKLSVLVVFTTGILALATPAVALCTSYTTLINGQPADATQVNANFGCAALTQGATIDSPTITGTKTITGTTSVTGTTTFSGAVVATSTLTPSTTNGIVGTTTGNNANAGSVGEYVSATNSGGTSLVNNTTANITSITLQAGDWDVNGLVQYNCSTNASQAAFGGISTVSATQGAFGTYWDINGSLNAFNITEPTPQLRFNITSPTTIYLVGSLYFGSGTAVARGTISARRVR